MKNTGKTFWYGLSCGLTAKGYPSKFERYYKRVTRLSSAYACINDVVLIVLGGALKRKERISARLGDVMSDLYMACATLKYYKDHGENSEDDVFVTWALQYLTYRAQNSLIDALANFPNKWIAGILRFLSFPYGRHYKKPSDALEKRLAKALMADEKTRQKMKSLCFVPKDGKDPVGRVEQAFQLVLQSLPLRKKLIEAMKKGKLAKSHWADAIDAAKKTDIITDAEIRQLKAAAKAVNEVIQVDEFPPYAFGPKNAHPEWQTAYEGSQKF